MSPPSLFYSTPFFCIHPTFHSSQISLYPLKWCSHYACIIPGSMSTTPGIKTPGYPQRRERERDTLDETRRRWSLVGIRVALHPNCGDGDGDGGSEPHSAALGAPRARHGSHHDSPNSRHSGPVAAQEELHCPYYNGRRQQGPAMAPPALGRPSVHSKVPSRRLCQQKLQLGSGRFRSAGGREAAAAGAREGVRCGVAASLVPTGYPKAAGEWGLGILIVFAALVMFRLHTRF